IAVVLASDCCNPQSRKCYVPTASDLACVVPPRKDGGTSATSMPAPRTTPTLHPATTPAPTHAPAPTPAPHPAPTPAPAPSPGPVGTGGCASSGSFADHAVYSRERYVAPGGSDGNDGGAATPWATIAWATRHVQRGDRVHVLAGTYGCDTDLEVRGTALA